MPKISEDQRQARRDQILAAAWQCFGRRGIHATSMEEIVREANLSAGAVYLYYGSKDELILAALASAFQQMAAMVMPLLAREEPYAPPVMVREISRIILLHAERNGLGHGVSFLMGWSEAQTNPKVKDLIGGGQRMYLKAMTTVVRKWQKRGDLPAKGKPEIVSKAMLSFFLGYIVQSAMIGGVDPETAARGIEGLIFRQAAARH